MHRLLVVLSLLVASLALAQEPDPTEVKTSPDMIGLEVSLKAGGHFPQVTNELGTSFNAILKVGYAPLEGKQLQLFVDLGYTQPSFTHGAADPRLGADGTDYQSTLVMRDLRTTLGVAYYFQPLSEMLLPYAGVGLRAHFLSARVEGTGGEPFGLNTETATRLGGVALGGVGYHVGPGLVFGELAFGYAPVNEKVTGVSNIGAASLLLGYGLLF